MNRVYNLPAKPRILVIVLRRLGDVLLTTPLIRRLKSSTGGSIDALVFQGTEGMLEGNDDIADVIAIPQHPSATDTAKIIRRLWRQYDLAISTQAGDRPTFLALLAGRRHVGFVPQSGNGAWWKRRVLHHPVLENPSAHRIVELLRLSDSVGATGDAIVVCPSGSAVDDFIPKGPYAVLHANPMFRLRRWTDEGWRAVAQALGARGLSVVVTGGPNPAEKSYLDTLWGGLETPVIRLDGKLDWPQLTALLAHAEVYVGPDTSMTHLAAASGCPTIALYGPASPAKIGPWPQNGLTDAWAPAGRIQQRGNVWTVQNPLPCLPCDKLGCEGHLESHSRCLDELAATQVLAAIDQALAGSLRMRRETEQRV